MSEGVGESEGGREGGRVREGGEEREKMAKRSTFVSHSSSGQHGEHDKPHHTHTHKGTNYSPQGPLLGLRSTFQPPLESVTPKPNHRPMSNPCNREPSQLSSRGLKSQTHSFIDVVCQCTIECLCLPPIVIYEALVVGYCYSVPCRAKYTNPNVLFPELLKLTCGNFRLFLYSVKFSPTCRDTGAFALSNVRHLHPSKVAFAPIQGCV